MALVNEAGSASAGDRPAATVPQRGDLPALPLSELVRLDGRVAVVTGGARGIGAAIAARLAEAGAAVAIGDLDEAAALAEAERLAGLGRRAVGAAVDAADPDSVERLADVAARTFDRLDIWVNNAGIYPFDPALDMAVEQWRRVIDLNLTGVFLGTRAAAKRMSPERGGVILNIASTQAFRGAANLSHYVASKHGVAGLTRALAVELAPRRIRVLGIAPTLTDTPGVANLVDNLARRGDGDLASRTAAIPLGRPAVPDDVARVALFCASDLAAFMTGSILPVDGGLLAR